MSKEKGLEEELGKVKVREAHETLIRGAVVGTATFLLLGLGSAFHISKQQAIIIKGHANLSRNPARSDRNPRVLDDGTVMYISSKEGKAYESDKIFMTTILNGAIQQVKIPNLDIAGIYEHAYSPNGIKAYLRFSGFSTEQGKRKKIKETGIWEIELATGKKRKITKEGGLIAMLEAHGELTKENLWRHSIEDHSLSPDGKTLAYQWDNGKEGPGNGQGIYIQDINGEPKKLAEGYHPSWSHDGKGIIFVSYHPFNAIAYASVKDGEVKIIKDFPDGDRVWFPTLSPDGERVVFDGVFDSKAYLMLINSDGTGLKRFNGVDGPSWGPRWVSDNIIIYTANILHAYGNSEVVMKVVPPSRRHSPKADMKYNRELSEQQMAARNDRFEDYEKRRM